MKIACTTTRRFATLSLATVVGLGSVASLSYAEDMAQTAKPDMKTDMTKHDDTMKTGEAGKMQTGEGGMRNQDKAGMTATGDIIDVATGPNMEQVTTLVAAVQAAGLVDALKGEGPFTVFAPTNEAFAKLPSGTVETLLKPENKDKLTAILLYHVHKGDAIKAADVKTMSLSTLNGKPLNVKADANGVMINDAKVIKTDVVASNGIIHWVDTVILP